MRKTFTKALALVLALLMFVPGGITPAFAQGLTDVAVAGISENDTAKPNEAVNLGGVTAQTKAAPNGAPILSGPKALGDPEIAKIEVLNADKTLLCTLMDNTDPSAAITNVPELPANHKYFLRITMTKQAATTGWVSVYLSKGLTMTSVPGGLPADSTSEPVDLTETAVEKFLSYEKSAPILSQDTGNAIYQPETGLIAYQLRTNATQPVLEIGFEPDEILFNRTGATGQLKAADGANAIEVKVGAGATVSAPNATNGSYGGRIKETSTTTYSYMYAYTIMWEQEYRYEEASAYRNACATLKSILRKAGIEYILAYFPNAMAIRPEMVECDYFDLIHGERKAVQEYMSNYPHSLRSHGRYVRGVFPDAHVAGKNRFDFISPPRAAKLCEAWAR